MGNPDEEQMRKSAVERYLAGTSASDTCSEIDLIRFIRSDLQPNVCGKKFKMPKKLMYEYIVASICTDIHALQVGLGDELIDAFEYPIPIEFERRSSLE